MSHEYFQVSVGSQAATITAIGDYSTDESSLTGETKPSDIAMYFLLKAADFGELITPLKMQKLVYYAYAWVLVLNNTRLFTEPIEAWANGPVVPSLYHDLKHYGAGPIGLEWLGATPQEAGEYIARIFRSDIAETLEEVFETYVPKSSFELVVMTHNEKPWKEARVGLPPTARCSNPISDDDIRSQYVPEES